MFLSKNTADIQLNKPTAVTIGTFDGVHIGHQKIIKRLVNSAKKHGLEATILTFFPHPRMILQQDIGLKLINTIDERTAILKQSGIDNLIVYPFTRAFSRLRAEEYTKEILKEKLNANRVIIGYDHRFGRNRTADIQDLYRFGQEFDFDIEEISKQEVEDVSVSSTKIRKALKQGNLERANQYLGAPFMLTGQVEKGKQLGRKLGYATANLAIKEDYKLIPKNGVYVAKSVINSKTYYGMMNIGTNPTVGGQNQTIETHFFEWKGELYGQTLQIELLKRIRSEEKFANTEELVKAMKKDEVFSKKFIQQQ